MDSETFGIEKGHGEEAVQWINEQVEKHDFKLEVRLYGDDLSTENFGTYELFSWRGDVKIARKLIIKASKRFKIKVIEGGYKTKERTYHLKKSDFVMVRKGDKVIGQMELKAPRFMSGKWKIIEEVRK